MDNYKIVELIGKGSSGKVYKAINLKNNTEVAIKKQKCSGDVMKEINNHKMLAQIACVPKLYEIIQEEDNGRLYCYIITELIKGKTLYDVWKEYGDWDINFMTLYHAFAAIKELHDNGYIHDDIHSRNLMWTNDKIYLIDFESLSSIDNNRYSKLKLYTSFDAICDDYETFISDLKYLTKDNNKDFFNYNAGMEKYNMLINYIDGISCRHEHKFIDKVLLQYHEIDQSNVIPSVSQSLYKKYKNDITRRCMICTSDKIKKIISLADKFNIDFLMEYYDIPFPKRKVAINKVYYFLENILQYDGVIDRDKTIKISLTNINIKSLPLLTNGEIIRLFNIRMWYKRDDIIFCAVRLIHQSNMLSYSDTLNEF